MLDTERVHISPFNLRDPVRHEIVIDRLAYWYYHPREWLKKAALMDDLYLLNSPFTFQSMEKHSAYCAMIRLGMHVPDTVLGPTRIRLRTPAGLTRRQLQRFVRHARLAAEMATRVHKAVRRGRLAGRVGIKDTGDDLGTTNR